MVAGKFWIGTSGYSYKDWRHGNFYPEEVPQKKEFEFYAKQFDTTELNNTFYRLPKPAMMKNWDRRSPLNFRFFVKGSRYITHIKRLKDPDKSVKKFFKSTRPLEKKIAGYLWQLPPRFKADAPRLGAFLKALKKHSRAKMVFEFRDPSWFCPEIRKILKKAGAVYCRADMPEFYKKTEIPDTANFVYLRRHGPCQKRKYSRRYPPESLKRDKKEIRGWLKKGKSVFAYFNNDVGGAAPRDAKQLELLVEGGGQRRGH